MSSTNMRRYRAEGRPTPPKKARIWDERQQARFFARVTKGPGCWEWTGPTTPFGHGTAHINGWTITAHRAAWEIAHGSIPEGMQVCHHCDNPRCVRLDHLYLGTQRQNMADASARRRFQYGDQHWTNRTARERDESGRWVTHGGAADEARKRASEAIDRALEGMA